MVTVQQVFDIAIHLMDEQSESNGGTVTVDTEEYRYRTLSILNTIIPALYPYSGNFKQAASGRAKPRMLDMEDYSNPDMEQAIPLDDTLALAVLPYKLAAQLLSAENTEMAAWMRNQADAVLMDIRHQVPASFEPISLPYGF